MKKIITIFSALFALVAPILSFAHVGYVVDNASFHANEGPDFAYLLSPLQETNNILLFVFGAIGIVLLYWLSHKSYFIQEEVAIVNERLETYHEFVPWILRLSLGIALIGAGAGSVLISPLQHAVGSIAGVELALGFLILLGFVLVPVTILAAIVYLTGLAGNFYLFGNFDFFAIALGVIVLGSSRPGLDDLLGMPKLAIQKLRPYVPVILRMGVGAAMMFLAVYEKILNPHLSALVVQNFHLTSVIPVSPEMWVLSAGVVEFLVGLCLFIGFHTRLTVIIAFAVISMTFFFFGEEVYSHVTLFGVLSAIFIYGGGKWSIDRLLERKNP